VDIYDNARDQHVIDSNLDTFSSMTGSLQGSARRLGHMARQGDRVAILKVAGILIGAGLALWIVGGFILRLLFGSGSAK
jgi:blocked-early-in-transport protein 1